MELWAKNSGEAITWLFNLAQQCGAQVSDTTKKWTSGIAKVNDYEMNYLSIDFGPKPYNTGEGMKALAEYAFPSRDPFTTVRVSWSMNVTPTMRPFSLRRM